MTRGEIEVLVLVARGVRGGRSRLPKTYFQSFPHKRRIAKSLMWDGFLESGGTLGDGVQLTPAGHMALEAARKQGGSDG